MTEENIIKFKEILSQYSEVSAEEITDDMRFREDLQMSSLDFMTLLGEIEDEFDIEFDEVENVTITTVGEAIEFMEDYL